MTCDTRSTGPSSTPYTCQLSDGHSGDVHGAVVSGINIAVWGPGYGWGPTYVGHRPSQGAPSSSGQVSEANARMTTRRATARTKGESIVVVYLAREHAEGRLLPHDKAAQVASFVTALNRGRGVVIDRPARAGRNMADSSAQASERSERMSTGIKPSEARSEASRTWRDAWWCEMPEHLRRIGVADHMDK